MLKRTITYENPFTNESVTEDHYFHLSKADLVEMQMEEYKNEYTTPDGRKLQGMEAKLQRIVDSEDGKAIMAEFKDIIRRSYGKRDGNRFIKNQAVWEEFASTEAYSQLIFELCTDADAGGSFINQVAPNKLIEQAAAEVRERAKESPVVKPMEKAENALSPDEGQPEPRLLSGSDVVTMDPTELQQGLASGKYKLQS